MRLIIRELKKTVEDRVIFDGASYSFHHGIVYGIVGNDELETTTFLQCINGDEEIDDGTIRIESDWKEYRIRYNDVGIISDTEMVPEYMTGYELINNLKAVHGISGDNNINNNINMDNDDSYFEFAGLSKGMRDRLIKEYNPNDRRKLSIVSNLIIKPSIIIFYNPFNQFNKNKVKEFKKIIDVFSRDRIVIVLSELPQVCEALCDECLSIEDGRFEFISNSATGEDK